MKKEVTLLVTLLLIGGFKQATFSQANPSVYPNLVDTYSKPIVLQEKKVYELGALGVKIDNLFDGARLSNAHIEQDSIIVLSILPENRPINPSPWYAFRIQSELHRKVYIKLLYDSCKHRYNPKLSNDLKQWNQYDGPLEFNSDSTQVLLSLEISHPMFVSAQEVVTSSDVKAWCEKVSDHSDARFSIIGKSTLNRPLYLIDIRNGKKRNKPIIVIFSRQHPPEITGYFAMQKFIERILQDDSLATLFRSQYRILAFPLMNPDGVDLGHWRHNGGGVDLNRDWAYYRQTETRNISRYVMKQSNKSNKKVLIGFDFHSTWNDVFYTNSDKENLILPEFKNEWVEYLKKHLEDYSVDERPSKVGQPVSKAWFYRNFGAVGLTYEVGDNTSTEQIFNKGIVSAEALMKILLREH